MSWLLLLRGLKAWPTHWERSSAEFEVLIKLKSARCRWEDSSPQSSRDDRPGVIGHPWGESDDRMLRRNPNTVWECAWRSSPQPDKIDIWTGCLCIWNVHSLQLSVFNSSLGLLNWNVLFLIMFYCFQLLSLFSDFIQAWIEVRRTVSL